MILIGEKKYEKYLSIIWEGSCFFVNWSYSNCEEFIDFSDLLNV